MTVTQCESCELLCVRVTSVSSSCVAIVVYRTRPVTSVFFTALSDVLDRVSTFTDPTVVVGDINIHLDRPEDLASRQFTNILAAHGLACGLLDIVATREDLPPPPVEVVDVGLSDRRLLRWTTSLVKPSPVYTTRTSRPWRRLDVDKFRAALMSSSLCRPDAWIDLHTDVSVSLRRRDNCDSRPTCSCPNCDVSPSIVRPLV